MPSRTFLAREGKSISGFKASKDRLTVLWGADAADDLKLEPMFFHHSKNSKVPSELHCLLNLCPINGTTKPEWQHIHLQHGLLNSLSTLLGPSTQKIRFKLLQFTNSVHNHTKILMEIHKINVVCMPANTASTLQPKGQEVRSIFKSYYLRNTFCKAIAAIDSDSSDGSGKNQFKTFWEGCTILDATKTLVIHGKG